MNASTKLSVILITKNEERDLPGCLESIKTIADEVVLIDSGSTDKTLEIARRVTDRIFHNDWDGFSKQKQFALEKARGLWILNIDADERVSPELAAEIKEVISRPTPYAGYEIPFQHFFCNRRLFFGSGAREKHVRLFLKEKSHYGVEAVHEGIQVAPPIGRLRNPIHHFSYRDIHDYLGKCDHYTTLIAQQKFSRGERFHWWHHGRLLWEFFVRYFLKLGFLDGNGGFVYAALSSYYVWLKFIKLRDFEARRERI